jgi:hypothetical protein
MGFATHLGPWLLGTVKNTTGTTAGNIRNMGSTIVAQTIPVTASTFANLTGTLGAIPAGALITSVQIITSTLFDSATTLIVTIGGTNTATATTITAAGVYPITLATTFASTAANVGSTDALITYTATGTPTSGAATIVVSYVVRNGDGSANPTSTQN